MIGREDLYYALKHIVPNANFSFWPDDGVRDNIDMGYDTPLIKMAGWVIEWNKANAMPCPTWDAIQKLDKQAVQAGVAQQEKNARDDKMSQDLSIVANYQTALLANPKLDFSAYLDSVEATAQTLQAQMKAKANPVPTPVTPQTPG